MRLLQTPETYLDANRGSMTELFLQKLLTVNLTLMFIIYLKNSRWSFSPSYVPDQSVTTGLDLLRLAFLKVTKLLRAQAQKRLKAVH